MATHALPTRRSGAFRVSSSYEPQGDQPRAIEELREGLERGDKDHVLLGVTGSGKTFTVAKVIEAVNRPTLVIAHNKTLAAQLFQEFKEFFPDNAVEYFVSYYDYYQPEAYVPASDTYIEKEATINDEIDRMRLSPLSLFLDTYEHVRWRPSLCRLGAPARFAFARATSPKAINRERSRS